MTMFSERQGLKKGHILLQDAAPSSGTDVPINSSATGAVIAE
jgi:hypothetical protein